MDFILLVEIVLFVILLGFSAFFSSSETAFFSLGSMNLEQMKKDGNPKLGLIEKLLAEPRRLIVTILIGNEFVNVAASVISTSIIIQFFGPENKLYNLLFMIPVLLLFGEITPKTLAIKNKEAFASFESGPIAFFSRLISPIRFVVRHVSEFFITMMIGKERSSGNIVTEDMVRTLAQDAVGSGALDKHEAGFIENIFEFGNKRVKDILTPRADITFISINTSITKIIDIIHNTRQTRFPVFGEHRDDILGFLHARDLLSVDLNKINKTKKSLKKLLRKPYFIPETKAAIEVFDTFRKQQRSFALTVDEYGGVTGLITMEDLLERIFGDIPSPSDEVDQFRIKNIENNRYSVDGTIPLKKFNQFFNTTLSEVDIRTLGGLVLHNFGELPKKNRSIIIDQFKFVVSKIARNRIEELYIEILDTPTTPPNDDLDETVENEDHPAENNNEKIVDKG